MAERAITVVDVGTFEQFMRSNEQWLMNRILEYSQDLGYSKYTATLEEAWRLSIRGLTDSLLEAARAKDCQLDIRCEEDVSAEPAVLFGVTEARLHRSRGVPLNMFFALMKYYGQAYEDLCETLTDPETARAYRVIVVRFFDRIEIGFSTEWAGMTGQAAVAEMQDRNRAMTDEKVKYLTVFESVNVPVILLDAEGRIENLNEAAAQVFGVSSVSGSTYYSRVSAGEEFAPLADDIRRFLGSDCTEEDFERELQTPHGGRHYIVRLKRLIDVSGTFSGITVVLTDIARRKAMEDAALQSRAQYLALFENMVDAFAQHDAVRDDDGTIVDFVFTEVNSAFEEMFTMAAQDVVGHPVSEVWPPGDPRGCD